MPSSATHIFTDPDMYFSGIRNLQIDGVITKRGEFRAKATRIDMHRLWMHRFDESLPRIMRITPSGKRSLILFATNPLQPEMQVSGIEASQDQIAMFGLDWPYYLRSSAACGWGTMSLTPEDLAAVSEAIIGRALMPPSFPRWTKAAARSGGPSCEDRARHSREARSGASDRGGFGRSNDLVPDRGPFRQRAQPPLASRDDYAARGGGPASTPDGPLYMPQLCATVGASYTRLHDCCQEYLGMSPKRYLWLRRMHLVRQVLRSADADKTTVTEIATDYGFWELGRFAVAYRSLFGEAPSAALRRPPEDPKPAEIIEPVWKFVKSA
jgi:AraC-like DNA-binding protein